MNGRHQILMTLAIALAALLAPASAGKTWEECVAHEGTSACVGERSMTTTGGDPECAEFFTDHWGSTYVSASRDADAVHVAGEENCYNSSTQGPDHAQRTHSFRAMAYVQGEWIELGYFAIEGPYHESCSLHAFANGAWVVEPCPVTPPRPGWGTLLP